MSGRTQIEIDLPAGLSEGERERADRIQAELVELRRRNPLGFYRPHAKQARFHGAAPPEDVILFVRLFAGGNQSGKTTAGIADDLIQCVDRDCLPEHLLPFKRFEPPIKVRVFTPDLTKTGKGSLYEKLQELVPLDQLVGGSWDAAFDKEERKLHFVNGSWMDFLSYEQDEDKFGSVTLDRVHFDEEPPGAKGRRIYNQARMRVMAREGDIIITMTPEEGMSWVFDEIVDVADGDRSIHVTEVATDDNTSLNPEAVRQAFKSLTPEEQDAKRKGRFVAFGGLVARLEDRHKVDRVSPKHVRGLVATYCIIDPGAAQGAVLWVGVDKDDVILCFDEHYPGGHPETLVENVAKVIREKNAFWGIDPYFLIDPSARNRTTDGGAGVEAAYHEAGIFPTRAQNDRFHSIMQLRRRVAAEPHPGLVVSREGCPKLLWELGRWRVAEDERTSQDRVKRGPSGDTFATTGPDHLGDCLRYVCMECQWGPIVIDQIDEYRPGRDEAPPASWINREEPAGMF